MKSYSKVFLFSFCSILGVIVVINIFSIEKQRGVMHKSVRNLTSSVFRLYNLCSFVSLYINLLKVKPCFKPFSTPYFTSDKPSFLI